MTDRMVLAPDIAVRVAVPTVVDIETFPIQAVEDYLEPLPEILPPDLDAIQPAGNLKDPVKVEESVRSRRLAALHSYQEAIKAQQVKRQQQIRDCALDPDLCQIVALGWMPIDTETPRVQICQDERQEKDAIEMLWRELGEHCRLVGFRALSFDLPILMRRSLYLRVPCPTLNLDRYRSPHVDLYNRLTYNGVIKGHSLKFYLSRFNIPNDDPYTGEQVFDLVTAGDWEAVRYHNYCDVLGEHRLYQRLRNSQPVTEGAF